MNKETIKKLFNKYQALRDMCEKQDKTLNDFVKLVSEWQSDWYILINAIRGFIDAVSILNPDLWEDFSRYYYDITDLKERKEWMKIKINWKEYLIHNDTDFLKYLLSEYT